jgi:hypothetical protein
MKTNLKKTVERIETFLEAWEKNAATKSFAGLTLQEFTEATKLPIDTSKEIKALRQEAQRKRVHALNSLVEINPLLERVVFAVQGSAEYGSDSAFYQEMGYIRKSDRKRGLTRKRNEAPDESPTPPDGNSPSTDAE